MAVQTERALWQQKIDVERVKREGLDVDLERLEREGYASLTAEEFYRLKTWGVCSQRTPGLHMVRVRVPGGRIEAGRLRAVAALSERLADGEAHITTRQNLELHSVPSQKVRQVLEGVVELGLTTRSACGHTVRNIVGCSRSGVCAAEPFETRPTVVAIHDFFFRNAARYNSSLPRRLNVYVAGCDGCMCHAQVNDLGFVATTRGGAPGFQLWLGGSLASSPRLAHLLFDFVPVDEVLAVTEAVADTYCANGFRDRPAKARLKFLIEEWGGERFTAAVLERLRELRPDTGVSAGTTAEVMGGDRRPLGAHAGVAPQRQEGLFMVEAHVPLGDLTGWQVETLAGLATEFADGALYLTKEQNVELHDVAAGDLDRVCDALATVGLPARGAGSLVDVQVCAGSEWCVWGVGDSRGLARTMERELAPLVEAEAGAEPLRVHISGCSHGCAQHAAADVGLSAVAMRDAGRNLIDGYEVFVGGRLGHDPVTARRVGRVLGERAGVATTGIIARYLRERLPGEAMPEFVERVGKESLQPSGAAEEEGAAG
ncbi:MAG TPA: nitrite/sulfite reductase [Candidatus Dormibacteraeota bacterium]|jgi:sulfite reductase beta subunit-like hemoprotein|nr:nitrite/sulfite reductase [Candidatus Dormibacteraeota bacterium]